MNDIEILPRSITKTIDLKPKKQLQFHDGLEEDVIKDYPCIMYDGSPQSGTECFRFCKATMLNGGHNCINLRIEGEGILTIKIGQFLVKKDGKFMAED